MLISIPKLHFRNGKLFETIFSLFFFTSVIYGFAKRERRRMHNVDRFPRTNLDSGINKKTKRIVCNDIYEE